MPRLSRCCATTSPAATAPPVGPSANFGNTLLIPIDNSLLYVRPWYVKASGNAIPELDEVIVGYQNANGNTRVAVETSFRAALVDLFGPNVPLTLEVSPKTQIHRRGVERVVDRVEHHHDHDARLVDHAVDVDHRAAVGFLAA